MVRNGRIQMGPVLCILVFAYPGLFAGGPFRVDVSGKPVGLNPALSHIFTVDSGPLNPTWSNTAARNLLREAFAVWQAVPGSQLQIRENPSGTATFANFLQTVGSVQAGLNPMVFDEDGSIIQAIGYSADTPATGLPFQFDGDHFKTMAAIFNGPALMGYSESRLKALMIRTIGQALGLSYSAVNGPLVGASQGPSPSLVEIMFPGDFGGTKPAALRPDDVSGFLALYGDTAQGAAGLAALSGKVLLPDGISPAGGVGIVARNLANPFETAYGAVADADTGAFKIAGMVPGDYSVEIIDLGVDVHEVHGLPLRTNGNVPSERLALHASYREKFLGPFPGPTEFFNGASESADPAIDDPSQFEAVSLTANQTTGGVAVTVNRGADDLLSRLVFPWISNREGQFESLLVINNDADYPVDLVLKAFRNGDAVLTETVKRRIPARGMLEMRASELFTQLGSGSGYSVVVSAPTAAIRGHWVTYSLGATSGASPSQGVAIRLPQKGASFDHRAGKTIVYGFLPSQSGVISAPVLVNLDEAPANLSLRFFNASGDLVGSATATDLAPFVPLAKTTGQWINSEEDLYLIAETSGTGITGVAFVFDPVFLETAIANVTAVPETSSGATTLIFPWVSNREGEFRSQLAINNLSETATQITLTARRNDGSAQTVVRTVPANGFLNERADTLFDQLGSGAGYTVEAAATSGALTGQWVTYNLATASGRSPSQGVAVDVGRDNTRGGHTVLLGYLPVIGGFFAGPVIVNLGDEPSDAELQFFDKNGHPIPHDQHLGNLQPNRPYPLLANQLLPEWAGNVYAVVHSQEQPLTAVAFVFNQTYSEPALGNATTVDPGPAPSNYAFHSVNVIAMDENRVLPGQTVLISDGLVVGMGSVNEVTIPEDATVIEGGGGYLIPGLADAHTHLSTEGDLVMMLANGITHILNTGDHANEILRLKTAVETGDIPGPNIFAGQQLFGAAFENPNVQFTVKDTQAATLLATEIADAGYDFLKTYEGMTLPMLEAVNAAGDARQLAMVGHLPDDLPLGQILGSGMRMVAHIEEFVNSVFSPRINRGQIPEVVSTLLDHGTYVTTTLSTVEAVSIFGGGNQAGYQSLLERPGVEYMEPWQLQNWEIDFAVNQVNTGIFQQEVSFMKEVGLAMMEAGVPMLTGTDVSSITGMVPGFAIHEEFRVLQESGWPAYEILRAATRNFGDFIDETVPCRQRSGMVAPGYTADLLLLSDNPLDHIGAVKNRIGVMVRGKWFSEQDLQAMLEAVKTGYQTPMVP